MTAKKPDYEPIDYESLNKFLLGSIAMIRRKEIAVEEADAISKMSDKVIKNNLTKIMDANRMNDKTPIDFFKPHDNQVLIG